MKYYIRFIKQEEFPLLEYFLYYAIFQEKNKIKLPKEIIFDPQIYIYIKDFGKKDDICLLAFHNKKPVGAVWTRILNGKIKGFGNIDNKTPEITISVKEDFRRNGIATSLMKKMLEVLKKRKYKGASLSVQKNNFAKNLYKKIGFIIIKENEHDFIMKIDF